MKKSKRLSVVLELAEREEIEATEAVQNVRSQLESEQKKLKELQAYYSDYEHKFGVRRDGLRAGDISNQRQFLYELTQMQLKQGQQIRLIQQGLDEKLDRWKTCHLKYQALENLISRFVKEENRALDKSEQKLLDEWFSKLNRKN